MDLQTIIENTPTIIIGAAMFTAIAYPIASGLIKVANRDRKFLDILKDPYTISLSLGLGIGHALVDYAKLFLNK